MAGGTLGVLAGKELVPEGPLVVWRRLASRSLTLLVEDLSKNRNRNQVLVSSSLCETQELADSMTQPSICLPGQAPVSNVSADARRRRPTRIVRRKLGVRRQMKGLLSDVPGLT